MLEILLGTGGNLPKQEILVPTGVTPIPRAYHRTLALDGELYISGGWSGSAQIDQVLKFNPETGVCTAIRNASAEGRHSHNFLAKPDKSAVYQLWGAGGAARNSFSQVTLPANTWSSVSLSASGRTQRQESSAGVIGEFGYIFGGWDAANNMLNDTIRWTLGTATMTLMSPPNPPPARRGAIYEVMDDYLYILGGLPAVSGTRMKDFWRYSPVSNTWERLADFPEGIRHGVMNALNGKLYVHGGSTDTAGNGALMRVYDPVANEWSGVPIAGALDLSGLASSVIGESIYYFGGVNAQSVMTNRIARFTPP